ncbi:MAG: hypothetical protein IH591_01480 [Bacteroidales bacterium]|nr:hypothetical protein [Bacteroidales bacterium]
MKIFRMISSALSMFLVSSAVIFGQLEQEKIVKYEPGFSFTDGIYLNFEQVKTNSPIPKSKILTSADYNDRDFFNKIFESDKIYYYDEIGVRQELNKSDLWGFSRNGVLYIQVQESFNRITFVGSICHFVADITTYDSRYYGNSPYGSYYDPYYSPYGYSPYGGYYSPYSYGMPYRQSQVARNELKQYLIDFETGKMLDYDVKNVMLLIMKDAELHEEYVRLSRKKQKQLMFVYVRKYNERNPLFLPTK